MGNVRKMGENRIIEQQRSDKNYRTTKKIRRKIRYIFFIPSEENRIIEQQGTVNNRTFVLLNFRSIIPALTIYIIIYIHRYTVSVAVVQLVFPILDSARQSNYPWYATCRHAVDTIFASIGKDAYSPHLVWMEEPLSNYVCSDWLSSQHFPFNQSICSYEPVASYHMFICWFVICYFHISWS